VELEDIGDLTTLIGKNSSGKSNLLEALNLFFTEMSPEIERNTTFNDYLWYNRKTKEPIEFIVTIEFGKELKDIITEEVYHSLDLEETDNNLTICRQIVSSPPDKALWKTKYVKINGASLIENSKLVKKPIKPKKVKTSPPPSPSPESPELDLLPELLQNISEAIKGKFKLIFTTRDVSGPTNLWNRTSIVPQGTQNQLINLHESTNTIDEEKWSKIEDFLEEVPSFKGKLDIIRGKIFIKDRRIRFPMSLIGGGHQEILSLVPSLIESDVIIGIEEPETHLHSELARNFFNILKKASENCQIFITTHFPVFVDKADIENTWIIRIKSNETKAIRIEKRGDLKSVLYELGYKPSDILFADKILLVEGWTEKEVLPILAEKMGYTLLEKGISIFPTRGKDQSKYHLKMWAEITKNAEIPIFMLLDKDAEKEKKELLKENLINKNCIHL